MFNKIVSGGQNYKIGIYFGVALVLTSVGSQIKNSFFEIGPTFDWLFVLLLGISIFFFFMGIALNTNVKTDVRESPDGKGGINRHTFEDHNTYLINFNILSKSSFWIAGISAFLSFIRLGFIIWK